MNNVKLNVYIANLEEYVKGSLKGDWFDVLTEFEELSEHVNTLESEWFIADHESDLFHISEYMVLDELEELAQYIKDFEYGTDVANLLKNWTSYNYDIKATIEEDSLLLISSEDGLLNEFQALGEYELDALGYDLSFIVYRYFDTESFGYDTILGGEYSYVGKNNELEHIYIRHV
ncbi:antirestriction protein ArdA [Staphylococcus felis]|uniref:antirestriction protein ArdA n=1 Tax=Staphylococcus felis TaxID=46127 RepID=UPI000E23943D|nr:antirestriction protein ArdA [Staphylococcus felis]REI09522.1 hypothetical protein DOS69_01940 [Staphylococcus felis]REI33602.1 hypothetical protein DOS82_05745 [Staphylococcus felis]